MKIYLTDLIVKTKSYDKNPYGLHKILWGLFPEETEGKRNFLFRATPSLDGSLHIIMQSSIRPDLGQLSSQVAEVVSCEQHTFEFQSDHVYQFILLANPTTSKEGKRIPINYQQGLKTWLSRKLEKAASVDSVVAIMHPSFVFVKDGQPGRAHQVLFAGFLRVQDVVMLENIVTSGIGRSKFLGFGLLTLRGPYDEKSRADMAMELDSSDAAA